MLRHLRAWTLALVLVPFLAVADDLGRAAGKGDVKTIRQLVTSGADVNKRYSRGRTPLMLAVINDQMPAARTLLELGADLSAQDSNGETALHHAITDANVGMVGFLLQQGAQIGIRDSSGRDAGQHALYMTGLRRNGLNFQEYEKISDIITSAARWGSRAVQPSPAPREKPARTEAVQPPPVPEEKPARTAAVKRLPDSEGRREYSDSYRNYDITPQAFYKAAYQALVRRGWKVEKHELTWLVGSREKFGSHYKVQIRLIGDLVDVRYVPGYSSETIRSWLVRLGEDIKLALRPLRKKTAVVVAPPEPASPVSDSVPPPQ